ncbi:MAG: hypothetical protein U5K84_06635 [Alkalibacterium sp.]|nr:hypothetical protein [Alkalibacterium sp.]
MVINLAMAPPELGYWAQEQTLSRSNLTALDESMLTEDGLYHFEVSFDMDNIADSKVIEPDTVLRDIEFIIQDSESDFAGRAFIDNVRFEKGETDPGEDDSDGDDETGDETGDENDGETPSDENNGADDDENNEGDTPDDEDDSDKEDDSDNGETDESEDGGRHPW